MRRRRRRIIIIREKSCVGGVGQAAHVGAQDTLYGRALVVGSMPRSVCVSREQEGWKRRKSVPCASLLSVCA